MSLRKDKIVNVVMALIVFCVGVQTFVMVVEYQDMKITEYCIDHPNETLEVGGEWIRIVNCGEWLEDHPELVEKWIAIKELERRPHDEQ